jgi:hypothetical protein
MEDMVMRKEAALVDGRVETWTSATAYPARDPLGAAVTILGTGRAFSTPAEVVASSDLTAEEKRAILASWASDAWVVESAPAFRECPFGGPPVLLDDVLAALCSLDADLDSQPIRNRVFH